MQNAAGRGQDRGLTSAEASSQLASQAQDFGYEAKEPKQATARFPVPELNNELPVTDPRESQDDSAGGGLATLSPGNWEAARRST